MSLFDKLFGRRSSDKPPVPGFEHFGGEPIDPRNSRYWRSIPHPVRIAIPNMADSILETVSRVRAHAAGIDDGTAEFLDPWFDAEAVALGVAVEDRYLDQVRTEQGLWADEDALAYRLQLQAEALKNQLDIADADYRAGRDALLGEPGATPAWDAGITHTRHVPALPVPGMPAPLPAAASGAASSSPATETRVAVNEPVPVQGNRVPDTATGGNDDAESGEERDEEEAA
jgi:hypothetical protein